MSQHVLRDDHVMRPTRLQYVFDLLTAYGAFQSSLLAAPRLATDDELGWFHTRDYIEAVRSLSLEETRVRPRSYGFSEQGDNPPYKGMFESSALAVGGSLVAAEIVANGVTDVAFNIGGGLHHAMSNYASGFCIFNDPVIAVEYLRRRGLRPLYIDIDCHHGDGVQTAFYDTDEVMTISLHESGRFLFPGTGEVNEMGSGSGVGYAVNVPLAPYTGDGVFEEVFEAVVPPLVQAFEPDVIVAQLGIDTHFNDPITHLQLTVEGHGRIVNHLSLLAPRWVALGGGGYDLGAVARGWSLDYGIMLGEELPDEIPPSFKGQYGIDRLRDGKAPPLDQQKMEMAKMFAEASVGDVRSLIFPVHGIG